MGLMSSIYFYCLISCFFLKPSRAGDLINQNETLTDGKTLVSSGQTFVLGFFTPFDSTSTNRYLGIWYKNSPHIVVWVANRGTPITSIDGVFKIKADGNLVLLNGTKQILWSTNSSSSPEGSVAQLLDSGNLVVRSNENMDRQSYTWQSFDFPTDTLLPGMKMGWNFHSGKNWYLRSWKTKSDPSPGEFSLGIDNIGLPQSVLRKGSEKIYRTGLWNGLRYTGAYLLTIPIMKSVFVYDSEEWYFMYEWTDNSTVSRLVLNESGITQHYLQKKESSEWSIIYRVSDDLCDDYGKCGPNGICSCSRAPICNCLEGFVPRFQRDWDVQNWRGGCIRKIPLDCKNGEGFVTNSLSDKFTFTIILLFWLSFCILHRSSKSHNSTLQAKRPHTVKQYPLKLGPSSSNHQYPPQDSSLTTHLQQLPYVVSPQLPLKQSAPAYQEKCYGYIFFFLTKNFALFSLAQQRILKFVWLLTFLFKFLFRWKFNRKGEKLEKSIL